MNVFTQNIIGPEVLVGMKKQSEQFRQMAAEAMGERIGKVRQEIALLGAHAIERAMHQAAAGLTPSAASLIAPRRRQAKADDPLKGWPTSIPLPGSPIN